MRGIIDRAVWALLRTIRSRFTERRRRTKARQEPDLEAYMADLEAAGATVSSAKCLDSGPVIHAEFAGRWVDLKQRIELEYRLIDEMPSAGETALALRPGPG